MSGSSGPKFDAERVFDHLGNRQSWLSFAFGIAAIVFVRSTSSRTTHALRITVPTTQKAYIHPATHWASLSTDPNQPPMGLRVRLKASYDISRLHGQARVVAQALKTYGALVADNAGSPRVYISGTVDTRWVDDDLNGLKTIPASALEAVLTHPVVHGY